MGRTYIPNRRGNGAKDFDVNFSGAAALGCLMFAVGEHNKLVEKRNESLRVKYPEEPIESCTEFSMSEEACLRAAKKLRNLTKTELETVFARCKFCFEKGAEIDELKSFGGEWALFLETCGGYSVPS